MWNALLFFFSCSYYDRALMLSNRQQLYQETKNFPLFHNNQTFLTLNKFHKSSVKNVVLACNPRSISLITQLNQTKPPLLKRNNRVNIDPRSAKINSHPKSGPFPKLQPVLYTCCIVIITYYSATMQP